jgi:hypothetical protein
MPPEVCSLLVYSHSGVLTDMNKCPRNQHILSASSDVKFGGLLLMTSILTCTFDFVFVAFPVLADIVIDSEEGAAFL